MDDEKLKLPELVTDHKPLQDFVLHNKKATIRELVDASIQLRKNQAADPNSLFSRLKQRPTITKKVLKPSKHIEDFSTRQEKARVYANNAMHPEAVKKKLGEIREDSATAYAKMVTRNQPKISNATAMDLISNPFETVGERLLKTLV